MGGREAVNRRKVRMKFDVTKIAGYAEMSAEEKVNALEGYEFDDSELKKTLDENKNLKTLISNANSEAAEWKKKYRETLSEADRVKAEQEEHINSILAENKELKAAEMVGRYARQYVARGFSEESALATAKAFADGDFDTVFKNEQAYEVALRKQLTSDKVSEQTNLSGGMPPKPEDKEAAEIQEILKAAGVMKG